MDQLQDIIDVDVIFLQYDPRRESLPRLIKLLDIRIVGFDSFDNTIVDPRFNTSIKGKFICLRHHWYVRKLKEYMSAMRLSQLCIRHWTMKSGDLSSFKFGDTVFPDVTYMFDMFSEYWFVGRVESVDQNGFERLFTEEWSRILKREPPAKELLDGIQDRQIEMRLAAAASINNTEPIFDTDLLQEIIKDFSMSRSQSPVNMAVSKNQDNKENKDLSERTIKNKDDCSNRMKGKPNNENGKNYSRSSKTNKNYGKGWASGKRDTWRTERRADDRHMQSTSEESKEMKPDVDNGFKSWRDEPRKKFSDKEYKNKDVVFKNFNTKPSKFKKNSKKGH